MGVIMVRHTRPNIPEGTCYGQTDLDVADTFEQDATEVWKELPSVSASVPSPLRRWRKLAEIIASRTSLSVQLDPRLSETDFGRWEGLLWDQVPRHELEAWAEEVLRPRPHGGESVSTLKARVDAALLAHSQSATETLIVTHAGVIRAAMARRSDPAQYQTEIRFGGIVRLPTPYEVHP